MTHEEFTGVTFNDLDPPRTRISRSLEFSVVAWSSGICYRDSNRRPANVSLQLGVFTRTWLRYFRVIAIANPSVACLSLTFVCRTQGIEAFGNTSSPLCIL